MEDQKVGNFRKSCLRAGKIVYRCMQCGVDGVKLWRNYNSGNTRHELHCAACALQDQKAILPELATVKTDGTMELPNGTSTNRIGQLVPAIPTEEGSTFWGLRGITARAKRWWESLPLSKGGPRGTDGRKPGEIMDLMVEYVKLSREKSKIEARQDELKEQVDESLDLLGTEDYASNGYAAKWITSSWTDLKQLVEDQKLTELLPEYKRDKPALRITGPRE